MGEIADCISYNREFLHRTFNAQQEEALIAVCGKEAHEWPLTFHEIVLLVGMKGGKNFVVQSMVSYKCYKITCMVDPHSYFTKVTGRTIPYTRDKSFDIVNTSAVDESQARRVFFEDIQKALRLTTDPRTGERWFEKYAGLDLREGGFGDIKSKIIEFPAPEPGWGSIRLMSFNSTKSAPEGTHMLLNIGDELSRADTKIKHAEAKALADLGRYNTSSSFPRNVGKQILFSYPNETDYDLTYDRYEESFHNPKIFARKYFTWEFNPTLTEDMFTDEFLHDPIAANRIRKCIKPISKDNFFQPYSEKLDEVVRPKMANRIQYKIVQKTRMVGEIEKRYTGIEFLDIQGDMKPRCFATDLSKSKDAVVIVGAYNETIDEKKIAFFAGDTKEVLTTNKRPVLDVLIVIVPLPGHPIDYLRLGEIYTALVTAFPNIVSWNSDHYQNEKLRQELEAKGIRSETYNFSNPQQVAIYTKLRAQVWVNNFVLCDDQHKIITRGSNTLNLSELFIREAKSLVKDGNKIDHPPNGSKDVSDVAAIVVNDLLQLETGGRFMADGIDTLPEDKLTEFAERYMIERQRLRNASVPENEHPAKIAAILSLTEPETVRLKEYVEETYPNT